MPVGPGPCIMPVLGVWGVKCGAFSHGWKFRASAETSAHDMPEVLPCVGLCPRLLVYRERPLPESLRLLLFWRPRGEVCRQRRILIFRISNTDPSGSCVPNSGFKSEDVFLKGAGHHLRLCSVEPQLQQRPLYCTHAWHRASSERSGVHRDKSVLTALLVTVQTIS